MTIITYLDMENCSKMIDIIILTEHSNIKQTKIICYAYM